MRVRIAAALAGVVFSLSAAAGSAQTTMAPTAAPVVGPTAAPPPVPAGGAAPSAGTPRPMGMPVPPGSPLALDARYLRGARTGAGYRLTGQALVKDACTAARFSRLLGNIFPPFYNVVQYRRPGTMGLLCIPRLTWVTIAALSVVSTAPPRFVTVHTQKGSTRVPIPRH